MFRRGLVGYLPSSAVQAVIGLCTIALFTRVLSPRDYGDYALAFSAMSLGHTLFFTWMEAAMARFQVRAREKGELAEHLATLYRMWFAIASVFAVIGVAAVALWPAAGPVKWAMAAGLFAILTRSLLKFVQERRRAEGEVAGAVRLDVVQSIGGFLLGLAFIAAGARASGAIGGMGAIAAVILIFCLPGEMSAIGKGRAGVTRARSYFAYGAPVAAGLVLSAVMATTDRFLLAAFDGESAVGAYHAGSSLAGRAMDAIFIWLAMAGGPAMIAALERGGEAALHKAAKRQAETMIAIGLPAMVGLVLVARPLAAVMIGPSLSVEAGMVAAWIAIAGFLAGLTCYYLNLA
ncbi:MAG: lipopolysaccharide biosynthesis protein, partial [Caulobacteraceae bacterium]